MRAKLLKIKRCGKEIDSKLSNTFPPREVIKCENCGAQVVIPRKPYEYTALLCSVCNANNTDNRFHNYCCKCGAKFEEEL